MKHPIINIADIELQPRPPAFQASGEAGERFDARMGRIGERIGARQLGYNITCVPPGKRAFPLHSHHSNEEMFFILEGAGQLRIGAETHPVRAGDFIACPTGGPETAHQLVNTGQADLKYLAVSTAVSPEVCEYPDSGKFAVSIYNTGGDGKSPWAFRHVGKPGDARDYWEGE
ncbi:MAG: cupin domain-containing protein [Proteobacteria bacterium]|nr:cupin domain-containing protein [Pseudomonadota bacterium]